MDQMIAKQHDDIADVDENPQESKDVQGGIVSWRSTETHS